MMSVPRMVLRTIAFTALMLAGYAAHAAGVAANTTISNTVTVDYVLGGTAGSASDSVSLVVEEVLDVSIVWQDAANVPVLSPSADDVTRFTVTNLGNGSEQFELSVDETIGSDDFNPVSGSVRIWIDDGDGSFSAVDDTLYDGSNGLVLDGSDAENDSLVLYVLLDIPADRAESDVTRVALSAVSSTADAAGEVGNPGAEIAGGGDGGTRANVGAGGAGATAVGAYEVGTAAVSIDKSVEVIDAQGDDNPYTGATLRYNLQVNVGGSVAVDNLVITDAIPVNTTYTPASMTLDGAGQTDADDAPATDFSDFNVSNPDTVTVDLTRDGEESITPPATFNISFEVTID